jgi:ATP-dependent DNA helicase RecQ
VKQLGEKFSGLTLTPEGVAALKKRQSVTLTKPVSAPEPMARRVGEISCDEVLFDRLRQLRKRLADERDVPAYIVFSDVALRLMARNYPASEREFTRISGVGEKKLREFGSAFLAEIAQYLQTNPRQIFADDSFAGTAPLPGRARLGNTARETLRRFRAGESVDRIAAERMLTAGTIYGHLAEALSVGEPIDVNQFLTPEEQREIVLAFRKTGFASLSPVFEALGGRYDYGRLRMARAAFASQRPGGS